eukprot:3545836-Rhodomonas_salina.1
MWRNIEELKEKLKAEKEKVKNQAGKWKEGRARLQTELAQATELVEKAAREREAKHASVRANSEKAVALAVAAQSEAPASSSKTKGSRGWGSGRC